MFTRLYKPFLWRSLQVHVTDLSHFLLSLILLPPSLLSFSPQVANPYVRANAATLLLDGFPLSEADMGEEKADDLLQKQFDTMRVRHVMSVCMSCDTVCVRHVMLCGCHVIPCVYVM